MEKMIGSCGFLREKEENLQKERGLREEDLEGRLRGDDVKGRLGKVDLRKEGVRKEVDQEEGRLREEDLEVDLEVDLRNEGLRSDPGRH